MSGGKSPPPLPLRKPPGYRDPNNPVHHAPPPRKPIKLPSSFPQARRRRSCCRILCCCTCISLFILTIVFSATGTLFYLWYQPRLPVIRLKSINFTKFNVSNSPDGPDLDAESAIGVAIRNPNENFAIVYDRTRIFLNAIDGDANLGEQTIPGFVQDTKNTTTLRFATEVRRQVIDGKSAKELKKGFKDKNLKLEVEIRSGIGLKQSRRAMSPVQVNVVCGGVRLNQVQGGDGAMPKCRIKVLNWFYIN